MGDYNLASEPLAQAPGTAQGRTHAEVGVQGLQTAHATERALKMHHNASEPRDQSFDGPGGGVTRPVILVYTYVHSEGDRASHEVKLAVRFQLLLCIKMGSTSSTEKSASDATERAEVVNLAEDKSSSVVRIEPHLAFGSGVSMTLAVGLILGLMVACCWPKIKGVLEDLRHRRHRRRVDHAFWMQERGLSYNSGRMRVLSQPLIYDYRHRPQAFDVDRFQEVKHGGSNGIARTDFGSEGVVTRTAAPGRGVAFTQASGRPFIEEARGPLRMSQSTESVNT